MIKDITFKNDKEWHEWRDLGIGASEVPIILGISPYISVKRHTLDKLGLTRRFVGNKYTEYGKNREPVIRKIAEESLGFSIEPAFAEYDEWPTLRASLDGYNKERNVLVEIKTCTDDSFKNALKGIIPPHYLAQMQTQILCSNACRGIYIAENPSGELVLNEVLPDTLMHEKIVKYCKQFWDFLEKDATIRFIDQLKELGALSLDDCINAII